MSHPTLNIHEDNTSTSTTYIILYYQLHDAAGVQIKFRNPQKFKARCFVKYKKINTLL